MKLLFNIGIPAVILSLGVLGFVVLGQKPEVPKEEKSAEDDGVDVVTAEVRPHDQPIRLELDGEAATYRVVTIGTEVDGRVIFKADISRSGTRIMKDEVLFKIDSEYYKLEFDRLTAQKAQAVAELHAVGVDLTNTLDLIKIAEEDWALRKKQLARMKELHSRKTANDAEVEEAMNQELMARNSLQGLRNQQRSFNQQQKTKRAGLKLVRAQLARAKLDLERCEIRSPLDGRIVDDIVEEGDYVKSGDDLVHVSDGSRMEIKCQLQGDELAWVWRQRDEEESADGEASRDPLQLPPVPCEVAFEFEGVETIWDGVISQLEGTGIDRETRTFPCRVLIEEPDKTRQHDSKGGSTGIQLPHLLSGLFVTVRIPVDSPVPLLRLPLEAVRPGGKVWVMREKKLEVRAVSVVHVDGNLALIREGDGTIQKGDFVVVSPLASVQPGMKLRDPNADKKVSGSESAAKDKAGADK